jgi:hypothetical protein
VWRVLAPVLVLGALIAIINVVQFVFAAVAHELWTPGSYHNPVLATLDVIGAVFCAAFVLAAFVGLFVRGSNRLALLGIIALFGAGMAISGGLLYIHVAEADVAANGFQRPAYLSVGNLDLYNATTGPVTVCLGSGGTCASGSTGPAALRGAGLVLAPGQLVSVWFDPGTYPLTIASPGFAAGDTVVTVPEQADYGQDMP